MTSSAGLRVYGLHFAIIAAPPLLSPLHHRGRVITLALPRRTNIRASPFCSIAEPKHQQQQQQKDKPKVVVISGPTGAGKSRLGLEIAKRLNGEIISADSVQVYRGLDIGSAKPSPSDRREVPHHLLDILHPSEEYSAGRFYDDARRATEDVVARGRVPVVVGGTGMYLRWYVYGKPAVPVSSELGAAEAEAELEGFRRSGRWDEAVELVVRAGDPRARSLAEGDWLRLRRSLEIVRSSGLPPSAFAVPYDAFKEEGKQDQEGNTPGDNDCQQQPQQQLDYDFHCFFLSSPRLDLYRSIDLRCEEMLMHNPGLLTESSWLLDSGLLPNTHSATRAIGYRQAMEYLLHCRETGGQCSRADFMHFLFEFQKASRNFAKRQMTWFRNERIYHWLDASRPMDRVLGFITDVCTGRLGDDGEGNGVVVVPNGLRMRKDLDGRGAEAKVLKSYRPKNRVFVNHDDCVPVLDWIRKTQSPRVLV